MLKPPLKWAGGKRWLVSHLQPLWQLHKTRRLVEPFCGGLAVALGLHPKHALLNDINPHLINFYQWLQRGLTDVTLSADDNTEPSYYARRDRFNALIQARQTDTREAAELFYYLNRTGYNGLCRFNRRGLYNVPKGSYRHIDYMQSADFLPYADALRGWTFHAGDFADLTIQPDDFIYADPPYDVPFTSYAQEDFTWVHQERLVMWLTRWDVPIVLSNQATPRIVDLYTSYGFELHFLDAPRRISSDGNRTPAREVLALKHLPEGLPTARQQRFDW